MQLLTRIADPVDCCHLRSYPHLSSDAYLVIYLAVESKTSLTFRILDSIQIPGYTAAEVRKKGS